MSEQIAPYSLDIDIEHRFIRQTWREPVTAEALISLWRELATDPRGLAGFDTLIDLRGTTVALSTSDVVVLANMAKRQPPSQRAVVTTNEADFGAMRMLQRLAEPGARGYGVFRTVQDACAWLGNPGCA